MSPPTIKLFPGDRLIVGRNDAVKKTIQVDRSAPDSDDCYIDLAGSVATAIPQDHQPGEPRGAPQ